LLLVSERVERLLPGGEALAYAQGKPFLVRNAIPGDIVQCRMDGKRRGILRGRVETRMQSSLMRVEPICRAADKCGGCALQFLDPNQHATVKSSWVQEAFQPFTHADTVWHPIDKASEPGQRRTARWWRGSDAEGTFLGFRVSAGHTVVRASSCPMVCPEMDTLRLHLQHDMPESVESVQMTQLADGIHVAFEGLVKRIDADIVQRMIHSIQCFSSTRPIALWWRSPTETIPLAYPIPILHDRIPAGDHDIQLPVGPDDFIQGDATGNRTMVTQVQQWAETPRFVADLFCGIGNLSLPLACSRGASIRGLDQRKSSIRMANASAKRMNLNAHYDAGNLFDSFDTSAVAGADVLILDPPRAGAKRICRNMGTLLPSRIIMINCDVASGARDAAELHRFGYHLSALRALDLFPYSGHVEAMSLWQR